MPNGTNQLSLLSVHPDQLILTDVVFAFSYPQSGQKLLDSISSLGIVNPLTVCPDNENSKFKIICGAKRLHAAQSLNFDSLPVRVISEVSLSDGELFDIAFLDNITTRHFNLIEQAGIISILDSLVRKNVIKNSDNYLAQLGLNAGSYTMQLFKDIYSLNEEMKHYLLHWNISSQHAARLALLEENDREALFTIIKLLQIHGGKLKQCIELMYEIGKRDHKTISTIINEAEFQSILNDNKTTQTQKQAKILALLQERRYPDLTQFQKEFAETSSSLNNIGAHVITPPYNFEGDSLRASISFKSISDLDSLCDALRDESNREKIRSLLKLL